MSDAELLEETNRLLRRMIEIDEERRAENDRAMKEFEARRPSFVRHSEALNERLKEMGLGDEATGAPEEDWEARMKEASRKATEEMESARSRETQFKEELLAELSEQSSLLRQISEKLGQ